MASRKKQLFEQLSRRERQIMEIVYALESATSQEVHERMANAASYSAVRAQMRILVEKGFLNHRRVGLKYVFSPTVPVEEARGSALTRMVQSFFDNSPVSVVAALLGSRDLKISAEELAELKRLIAEKETSTKGKKS